MIAEVSGVQNIKDATENLKIAINNAGYSFEQWINTQDDWDDPSWSIEKCHLRLLALVEAMGLQEFHKMVLSEYLIQKGTESGFLKATETPDGELFSASTSRLSQFLSAIEQFFPKKETTVISKDLLQIIRDIHYTITDKDLYQNVPKNESDVQIRIEGILKCVFPDLKHKPTLTKSIKNFEPDTGIPSMETLIEYKFLSDAKSVPTIADQVLADTRGYVSKDWSRFIYVIYETNRFRPETQWDQFLRQSGIPENTVIVVLCGEPPKNRKAKVASKSAKGK